MGSGYRFTRLEGFWYLVITPRSVGPSLEQLQGTVSSNLTIELMGPFEESRGLVTSYDYPVFMPNVGLISFLLLPLNQGRVCRCPETLSNAQLVRVHLQV